MNCGFWFEVNLHRYIFVMASIMQELDTQDLIANQADHCKRKGRKQQCLLFSGPSWNSAQFKNYVIGTTQQHILQFFFRLWWWEVTFALKTFEIRIRNYPLFLGKTKRILSCNRAGKIKKWRNIVKYVLILHNVTWWYVTKVSFYNSVSDKNAI